MTDRNDRLRVGWGYKIKDCYDLQGWKRQCKMEAKRQKSGKYIKEDCVKVLRITDNWLKLAWRYKI